MPDTAASQGIREIDAATAKSWLDAGQAVIVDVREPEEHAREHIPGAALAPLSRFDPARLPSASRLILHCRSGSRSRDAATRLLNCGAAEAYILRGGIQAWKAAGLGVQENLKVPISLLRQVQLTIGVILLAGTALSLLSPWFLILPGFIGAGQLFAGLSGTCGLASLLSVMPWNRAMPGAASAC